MTISIDTIGAHNAFCRIPGRNYFFTNINALPGRTYLFQCIRKSSYRHAHKYVALAKRRNSKNTKPLSTSLKSPLLIAATTDVTKLSRTITCTAVEISDLLHCLQLFPSTIKLSQHRKEEPLFTAGSPTERSDAIYRPADLVHAWRDLHLCVEWSSTSHFTEEIDEGLLNEANVGIACEEKMDLLYENVIDVVLNSYAYCAERYMELFLEKVQRLAALCSYADSVGVNVPEKANLLLSRCSRPDEGSYLEKYTRWVEKVLSEALSLTISNLVFYSDQDYDTGEDYRRGSAKVSISFEEEGLGVRIYSTRGLFDKGYYAAGEFPRNIISRLAREAPIVAGPFHKKISHKIYDIETDPEKYPLVDKGLMSALLLTQTPSRILDIAYRAFILRLGEFVENRYSRMPNLRTSREQSTLYFSKIKQGLAIRNSRGSLTGVDFLNFEFFLETLELLVKEKMKPGSIRKEYFYIEKLLFSLGRGGEGARRKLVEVTPDESINSFEDVVRKYLLLDSPIFQDEDTSLRVPGRSNFDLTGSLGECFKSMAAVSRLSAENLGRQGYRRFFPGSYSRETLRENQGDEPLTFGTIEAGIIEAGTIGTGAVNAIDVEELTFNHPVWAATP